MKTLTSSAAAFCQVIAVAAGLALSAPAQDKGPGQGTADQQKQNKADRLLTQQIRKAVEADKTLSMAAHNVKIISRDGTVTLKGSVKTDEEKKAIEDKATELAGAGKVTSEITVAPSGSK